MTQRKCRLFLVDAFTQERFCGNPAAVVLDADVLEEQEMRRIARELSGFEVAFVLGSDSPDFDVELRFFSPRREVGFVGHATVAAHYARAMADGALPHPWGSLPPYLQDEERSLATCGE